MNCSSCRWCVIVMQGTYHCVRYPPQVVVIDEETQAFYPVVFDNGRCGEYEAENVSEDSSEGGGASPGELRYFLSHLIIS